MVRGGGLDLRFREGVKRVVVGSLARDEVLSSINGERVRTR